MAGKVGPAVPITMMGALFITAMLVALLAPRIWRRGCRRTFRWFNRTSSRGPCYRCCCYCMAKTVGRALQRPPPDPHALRVVRSSSKSATISWEFAAPSWLSEDGFEAELRPAVAADNEWVALSAEMCAGARVVGGAPGDGGGQVYELGLKGLPAADTEYVVRLRATNGAGRSAWASAAVITRQLPVDDGGTGPLGAAAAEATYRWKQSGDEVELRIPLPTGTRARDLAVELLPARVAVSLGGAEVLSGSLCNSVKHDDSVWELDDEGAAGCVLTITLEKIERLGAYMEKKERWPCAFKGHPLIDIAV